MLHARHLRCCLKPARSHPTHKTLAVERPQATPCLRLLSELAPATAPQCSRTFTAAMLYSADSTSGGRCSYTGKSMRLAARDYSSSSVQRGGQLQHPGAQVRSRSTTTMHARMRTSQGAPVWYWCSPRTLRVGGGAVQRCTLHGAERGDSFAFATRCGIQCGVPGSSSGPRNGVAPTTRLSLHSLCRTPLPSPFSSLYFPPCYRGIQPAFARGPARPHARPVARTAR